MSLRFATLSGLVVLAFARTSLAADCTTPLQSTCINSDTLWPHAGAQRFLTVGGADTIASGQVAFGLDTTYLSRPIILQSSSPGPNGSEAFAVDNQVNANFLWAYGVTRKLELDFALPITLEQNGAGIAPITGGDSLHATAIRDLRFGLAYALISRPRVDEQTLANVPALPAIAVRFEVSAPTGDNDQFAGERTAVFIPSIAADFKRGRFFAGAEFGARLRGGVEELAGSRVGTQLFAGLGAGVDLIRSRGESKRDLLSLTVEGRALPTFAEQADVTQTNTGATSTLNGQHITPAEWAVALRTVPVVGDDLAIQLGGGGSIPLSSDSGITTPRFRFTLSLRYAPLGHDSDGDGVLDKYDHCPHQKGDDQGCPAKPIEPVFFDGNATENAPPK
jgi:hypothetical protein